MKLADKADYSRKEKEQLTRAGRFHGSSLRKGVAVCLSLSLCLLPLLSACQRKEARKEKKKLQIGVTIYDNYDTFLSGYMTAFEKEISKKRAEGVEIGLFRYNAAGSQALQNEQVEEMLEKDCDVLCVNLVDRTAPSEIIDMAKKKNVPIIFFNRELVDEDLAQWNQLYYIGADAKQSGILQGEMAAEDILSEEPEKPTPEVPLASPEDAEEVERRMAASRKQMTGAAVLGESREPVTEESGEAVLGESRESLPEEKQEAVSEESSEKSQDKAGNAEEIQDFVLQKSREDLDILEREASSEDTQTSTEEGTQTSTEEGTEKKALILSPRVDKNGDGVIQYLMFEGEAGHQDAIVRTEYSVNTLMQQGIPMEKLSYAIANWSRAEAQSKMMQFYPEFQDQIELILSNNDDMALGVLDAYDKIGLPKDKRPFIYGIDGTVVGLEAVKKGNLMGTVYNDEQGQAKALFQLAYRLGTGKKGPEDEGENKKIIRLPYQKVRREDSQRLLEEKEKK
ncbi:MAG: substrate-binding domain-containing protein [Oribacterium sinus]|uniref:D-galactose/methyl-galactoside binding periplasmic protein MglB n=1 Tax=Oribacterium sinus TaxID=237576 RepID=A0A930DWS7_9FIRM|nr:substrate-binding domain-containing protein [Oribacterium sinus]